MNAIPAEQKLLSFNLALFNLHNINHLFYIQTFLEIHWATENMVLQTISQQPHLIFYRKSGDLV
jgi:hypothetical protein